MSAHEWSRSAVGPFLVCEKCGSWTTGVLTQAKNAEPCEVNR